ncbi:MAG: epimerase [Desulfatitalea sp. BRH_c12]|nr:MAG: epimerase [Desulfatitalea sp. BRH_c12]
MQTPPVLVTGATGYVGGRLVTRLLATGHTVRAMGRTLEKMACRPWAGHARVQLVQGDMQDLPSLIQAGHACGAAYHLVHSMIAQKSRYAEVDRQSAINMRTAAEECCWRQIIYLGGLGEADNPKLSHHLASRHEVGHILQSGKVPTTVLRAAMILGSGSASFEILRYLVERLPVMITPRWVRTPTQPIAIENVLGYLVGCLYNERTLGETFDIGGPDIVQYGDLIRLYAQEAGLPPRRVIPVPVLTPRLSAHWIHWVTPVPRDIALPLTEGLSVPTICSENRIRELVDHKLIDCRQAMRTALDSILEKQVETCWSDAGHLQPPEWAACGDADYAGGTIVSCAYRMRLGASAEAVWKPIVSLGGSTGYYYGNWLWRLRGILDRALGGIGLRRGRRHSISLQIGDAVDFWRVLTMEPLYRLSLLAEMKMPGEAILDYQLFHQGECTTELRMAARFLPRGLGGLLYWYALYPVHLLIFKGMLQAIARQVRAPILDGPRRFDARDGPTCRWGKR